MKCLVTSRSFGKLSDIPKNILTDNGFEIVYYRDKYEEEGFIEALKDCDALIIGAHEFSEKALKAADKLKVVIKHGTGMDNINIPLCEQYGVHADNVPAVNGNAVADLAFTHIMNCARKVHLAANNVLNGEWKTVTGVDVYKKTLGLVGFGGIAKNVARRAKGFDMKVLAYDPFVTEVPEEFKEYVTLTDLDTVLTGADIVSIHVPLNDSTRNLIAKDEIAKMKDGVIIVNTSRGGILNEDDLYDALVSGKVMSAGLDVLEKEPMDPDNKLAKLDNVTITPHMGMYSFEAITAVSTIAAQKVVDFFNK